MAMSRRMWESQQERKRQERIRRAKMRRNCTFVVLLAIAAIIIIIAAVKYSSSDSTNVNPETENQASETISMVTEPPVKPSATEDPGIKLSDTYYKNAVFIGDALADGIGMYSLLPECNVYAKVGLTVKNVYSTAADNDTIAIIDQLKSKKYAKVFLAFGESELMSGNVSDFKKDYEELIGAVKDYQSSARIYLMAIPPVSEAASTRYGITDSKIKSINSAIKQLASSMSVYYSDCYKGIVEKDGFLAEGVSADGINLDKATYLKMLDYMSKHSFIPGDEDEEEDVSSSDKEYNEDEDADENESANSEDESTDNEDESMDDSNPTPKPTTNVLKDSHTNSSSSSSSSKNRQ